MWRIVALSLSIFTVVNGLSLADDKAVAQERKALAGTWKLVSVEEEGKTIPKSDIPAISFTVDLEGKSKIRTPDGDSESSSEIDPTKSPKTLNIEHLSGPFKGQKLYAIYKVEGNLWTVCAAPSGSKPEDRPRVFDTKTKKVMIFVWERVKEEKK